MKCKYAILIALGWITLSAATTFATVGIQISAETLRTAGGSSLMPAGGLVILVTTTNGTTFGGPTATSFASGPGDLEVARWSLGSAGVFSDGIDNLDLTGGKAAGQALALYWFPTLTISNSVPGAGTSYGYYRDSSPNGATGTGVDFSDPWFIPPDGTPGWSPFLATVSGSGSVANSAGYANFTVPGGNTAPVAVADGPFFRAPSLSLKIAITNLLANDTDANTNTLTFTGITGNSTNGAVLTTNATYVFYPSNASNVSDRFSYTISDGQGGVSTGLVYIAISSSVVGQAVSITNASGSNILTFAGIPTYNYTVQRATNVSFTGTVVDLVTTNAPTGGLFKWTDVAPPTPTAFYRLRYNSP
jgi:hypothetical protein